MLFSSLAPHEEFWGWSWVQLAPSVCVPCPWDHDQWSLYLLLKTSPLVESIFDDVKIASIGVDCWMNVCRWNCLGQQCQSSVGVVSEQHRLFIRWREAKFRSFLPSLHIPCPVMIIQIYERGGNNDNNSSSCYTFSFIHCRPNAGGEEMTPQKSW